MNPVDESRKFRPAITSCPQVRSVCACETLRSVFSPLLNREEGRRRNELTTTVDSCVHVFKLYECRAQRLVPCSSVPPQTRIDHD